MIIYVGGSYLVRKARYEERDALRILDVLSSREVAAKECARGGDASGSRGSGEHSEN